MEDSAEYLVAELRHRLERYDKYDELSRDITLEHYDELIGRFSEAAQRLVDFVRENRDRITFTDAEQESR